MAQSARQRQDQKNRHINEQASENANIGGIPDVVDAARRERCRESFRLFCETYFKSIFVWDWSDDHLRIIAKIEDIVFTGGQMAMAMPRGSGKSSLCKVAAVWALVYGHRSYVVLVGATMGAAKKLLNSVKGYLESNADLAEDFPEVCYPIIKLEGQPNRAGSQHINGERTMVGWTKEQITLPQVAGSVAAGAVIGITGLDGSIRGAVVFNPATGSEMRPDLAVIDDPQTNKSARSPGQVETRLENVNGSIMGLAGPGQKIAAFMPVTVIAHGDMADKILDRKNFPSWRGERVKLMRTMPTDLKAWEAYTDVWVKCFAAESADGTIDMSPANDFYLKNRAALDAGAEPSWPQRKNEEEVSAIQHAMNLRLERGDAAFQSEYQNDPMTMADGVSMKLLPIVIQSKVVDEYRWGEVPKDTVKITGFIDIHDRILFYGLIAWRNDFSGHVIDYGTTPKQPNTYFTNRSCAKTLADSKPNADLAGQIYHGLEVTVDLMTQPRVLPCGKGIGVSRIFIDSGYVPDVVKQFCRESKHKSVVIASKGKGVEEDDLPMNDYPVKAGVIHGWNWRHNVANRDVLYDTNKWKSFVAERFMAAKGDESLTLFSGKSSDHRLFCDHMAAETGTQQVSDKFNRTVAVWRNPRLENHWFDCVVGAAAAAGEQGIKAAGHDMGIEPVKLRKRRAAKVSF